MWKMQKTKRIVKKTTFRKDPLLSKVFICSFTEINYENSLTRNTFTRHGFSGDRHNVLTAWATVLPIALHKKHIAPWDNYDAFMFSSVYIYLYWTYLTKRKRQYTKYKNKWRVNMVTTNLYNEKHICEMKWQ